ncbi:HEPN domain-containing protein [Staphylothermus hellenicus]|uniref:HEPN domain protein n=1 Tax=Staphylothermus hellenicus (strain DSM 12710 / JCM 10830 / BK20S6-10-b1 / P8) TaxID=591019 RepID=D7D8D0_STAHD|nr:HEPN domain-containing protein [Staphylothermus hellenicus]ADI32026.1 HEPN domain protein [Staphylothermus hellenicus DSM 12710]
MGNERIHFLKRRALAFLECAEHDYSKKYYDLVLFHVEQFIQLYLKYLLYLRIGDYPKTNSLTRLMKDLIKVYEDCGLKDFYTDNLETLYLLEEAYISSRYIPREYDEEIARRILDFAKNILGVFKCLEKH